METVEIVTFDKSTKGTHVYTGDKVRTLYLSKTVFGESEPPRKIKITIGKED